MTVMNLGERIGLFAVLVGIAGGCSSMDPEDDTYAAIFGLGAAGGGGSSAGNAGSGGDEGSGETPLTELPAWSCLSAPPQSLMTAPRNNMARVQYRAAIGDFDTSQAIPDLSVQACITSACDPIPTCTSTNPAPTEQCAIVTAPAAGAQPIYNINLPYGFNGGLKLTREPDYAELNYFFGGPMVGAPEETPAELTNVVYGLAIPVLKLTARQRAYDEVGAGPVDITRGTLAVRTLTCDRPAAPIQGLRQGQRAAGVALEALGNDPAEDGAISWTISDLNQFTANRLVTDPRGVAGFLNALPVSMDVRAILPDDTTFGQATLRVRANVITLAELRPGLGPAGWGQ
jgi:hypothetical protein